MAKNITNKIIVVTGAAGGIGFEIINSFMKRGAKAAVILDIDEVRGVEAMKNINLRYGDNRSIFFKCDVTSDLEEVFKKILDTYGNVDVLVNNAGVNDGDIKNTIATNTTAVIEWTFKFWEYMRQDKGGNGGTIINVSSVFGYRTEPYFPVYQATKFALMGFTKSLGHDYHFKRTGVRIFAINPGLTSGGATNRSYLIDDQMMNDFLDYVKNLDGQTSEDVGEAAVEAFEKADSGTAWLIEGAKPIVELK